MKRAHELQSWGLRLETKNGVWKVLTPQPGSIAEASGILEGDIIRSVNDVAIFMRTLRQSTSTEGKRVNPMIQNFLTTQLRITVGIEREEGVVSSYTESHAEITVLKETSSEINLDIVDTDKKSKSHRKTKKQYVLPAKVLSSSPTEEPLHQDSNIAGWPPQRTEREICPTNGHRSRFKFATTSDIPSQATYAKLPSSTIESCADATGKTADRSDGDLVIADLEQDPKIETYTSSNLKSDADSLRCDATHRLPWISSVTDYKELVNRRKLFELELFKYRRERSIKKDLDKQAVANIFGTSASSTWYQHLRFKLAI